MVGLGEVGWVEGVGVDGSSVGTAVGSFDGAEELGTGEGRGEGM